MRHTALVFALLVIVVISGCSGKRQVKGKVQLTDKTPVGAGQVIFEKEGFIATGTIREDGSYEMGTLKDNDGVPPGDYTVYISGANKPGKGVQFRSTGADGKMTTSTLATFEPIIAKKYTSASTSDLKCKVDKSMTFDITVEPAE